VKVKKVVKANDRVLKAYVRLDKALTSAPFIEEGKEKKLNRYFRRIEARALALADATGPAIEETDRVTDEN
jgi:hypothetical protein